MSTLYACPVCSNPLHQDALIKNAPFRCENNHSFDVHKKGYVNLLLAQNKRSKAPGDDATMIQSRQRFLRAGHYTALANSISEGIGQRLPLNGNVLDAGCGEGYYLDTVAAKTPSLSCYGLDISKPAIHAASRNRKTQWCVASSSHPPFLDESFDAVISVFSRVDNDAFYRILKREGWVCMATPDHDHLMALRELIYDEVREYSTSKHQTYFDDRFELTEQHRIETAIHLTSSEAVLDLLGMTPHAHRLPKAAKERISAAQSLTDTACFRVYWFKVKK